MQTFSMPRIRSSATPRLSGSGVFRTRELGGPPPEGLREPADAGGLDVIR